MFDTYLFRLSNGETIRAMVKEGKLGKIVSLGRIRLAKYL
jgi:hypothetical protein